MLGYENLEGRTGAAYLDLVLVCAKGCVDVGAFQDLVRSYVKPILPHRFSIAVLGSLSFDQLAIRHMVGVDYPSAFLAKIPKQTKLCDRPVIAKWLATREPLIVDPVRDRELLSVLERYEVDHFGLGRMAVHGQIDLSSNMASYFSFAGTADAASDERCKFILRLVTPHLHAALMSIPAMSMVNPILTSLTALECDLLTWLAAGRSNAEIARIRSRSAATVRNQLTVLFRKIGATTRAEAVAIATSYGISLERLKNRTHGP